MEKPQVIADLLIRGTDNHTQFHTDISREIGCKRFSQIREKKETTWTKNVMWLGTSSNGKRFITFKWIKYAGYWSFLT